MTSPREQAGASLDDVERIIVRTRRAMVAAHAADHFIVWGVAWMIGFGAGYVTDWPDGWIWLVVVPAGVALSAGVEWRSRQSIDSPRHARILWFLLALVGFGAAWAVILHPFNTRHFGAYIASLFMFAYVAGGLWFGRFFIWLGVGVTALILVGVLGMPRYLEPLMAVAGGGSLLSAGLYIRRTWA